MCFVALLAIAAAATGPAWGQNASTHTVTFAEGTEDVGNWSFTPEAATNTGVTAGTVVTVKYNGTSRINSIELKSKKLTTPLTIEALTAGTVKVQSPKNGMKYKKNNEDTVVLGTSTTTINVAAGDKVAFYGNGTSITSYNGTTIGGSGDGFTCKVYGNIMSLVNEEHFDTATTLTANYAFFELFRENAKLSDASGLMLPATTLTERCYMDMFLSCVNLTTAPAKLPATTLTGNCYAYMFQGCTRLTTAPELPAPVLAQSCYYKMFQDCMNLNSVTCLATDISAFSCTRNWLDNAGTVVEGTKIFNAASPVNWPMNDVSGIPSGWTLVTPAHTPLTLEALTDGTVKVQSPKSGMQYTLNGGAKTPVTSAAIDVVAGDKVAFYGNGTSITSYDDTRIAGGDADVKVYGNIMSLVDEENFATATTLSVEYQFYNLFSENNHLKDASGLLLPATTLAPTCYAYMFHYCSSLTAAPAVLPATTLAEACYRGMFQDCMSLTTAPELPAQTLVSYCYAHMFQLCTKLNSVTCLATSGINQNGSTESWLDYAGTDQSVTTKTFNAASTAEWPTSVHGIPEGWTLGAQSTPEPVTLVPTGNTNEWTFTMPADNMLLMLNYATTYTVRFADGNNGWQVQDVTAATSATAPAVLQNVMAGDSLVVTAPATLNRKVKSVKAVKYVVPPTLLDNTTTAWADGKYAVPEGGLTYSDAITVSGDVTLVLTDGTTLTLNKGIILADGATLTVEGTGTMNVNGTDGNTSSTAGGNHGTLILTSGTLTATGGNGGSIEQFTDDSHGGNGGDAINGSVIVSGGTLTARGGNGGSVGDYCANCSGGNGGAAIIGSVTVNSGTLTATGGNGGSVGDYGFICGGGAGSAAISGDLTINSGTETLTNGANGQLGADPDNCSAGTGSQAVAGTVTDNR